MNIQDGHRSPGRFLCGQSESFCFYQDRDFSFPLLFVMAPMQCLPVAGAMTELPERIRSTQLCGHKSWMARKVHCALWSPPSCSRHKCSFAHDLESCRFPLPPHIPDMRQVQIWLGQQYLSPDMHDRLEFALAHQPRHTWPAWAHMYYWFHLGQQCDDSVICGIVDFDISFYLSQYRALYGSRWSPPEELQQALHRRRLRFLVREFERSLVDLPLWRFTQPSLCQTGLSDSAAALSSPLFVFEDDADPLEPRDIVDDAATISDMRSCVMQVAEPVPSFPHDHWQ